jgi:type II secretory pathway pseudopilin PulG
MIKGVRPDRAGGFLLIEVAVALIIVSMAFGYAFRSMSGAMLRLGRDYNSSAALSLAQSTLDQAGYDIVLRDDELSGVTEDGFTWSLKMAPFVSGPKPAADVVSGSVVRVSVAWKERGNVRQVRLSTVRLSYRRQT